MDKLVFLYLDRQVAACIKPAGMPTQEAEGFETDFTTVVSKAIALKEGREKVYLHAVHRLDTPASGIVLFARTSKSLSRLLEAFRERKVQKEYLIEVEGFLEQSEGKLENQLLHSSHKAIIVEKSHEKGQKAILTYKVEKKGEKRSWIRVFLETGRYHQIRCQFAHLGHPVVGDAKYGSRYPSKEIHLYHTRSTFPHPITKEAITVEYLP